MPSLAIPIEILVIGPNQQTASLDVTTLGTQTSVVGLNISIQVELPYRYMRLRGDLSTRYFGGNSSDGNFPEGFYPPPSWTGNEAIGWFNDAPGFMTYSTPNTIPDATTYDRYTLLPASMVDLATKGARILVGFDLLEFGPNGSFCFGMFEWSGSPVSPVADIAAGRVLLWGLEAEKHHLHMRGWYGTSDSSRAFATGLPIERFIGVPLLGEIEIVNDSIPRVAEFRLFERARDLDTPIMSLQLGTSVPPDGDYFSFTSLGRRNPDLPTSQPLQQVRIHYVDIEPGTGTNYQVPSTGLPITQAKWRPVDDRPPFLLRQQGTNTVYLALSNDMVTASDETSDTIVVDSSDPMIEVLDFWTESSVLVPGSTNPAIVKGSNNPGFSNVAITWRSTHTGTWTLRVDSTGATDGTEIASGTYPTASVPVVTAWDFSDLPQTDGTYDVTLYLIADSGKPTAKKLGQYLLP